MPQKVVIKQKNILTGWKTRRNFLNHKLTTFGKPRTVPIILRAHIRRMQNK